MKKSKKIGLSLNKKVISNLHQEQLNGGSSGHTNLMCHTNGSCVGDNSCGACTVHGCNY